MAIYIRLMQSFWNHRKTAKLRARIGDDALWIVPRLWSYAAESQPDGDFGAYSSEELALLIGCNKHAISIRQALIEVGFMDSDGKIHDWDEHNGYHAAYAKRGKTAADARWRDHQKSPHTPLGKEMKGDKHCFKHATSIPLAINANENEKDDAVSGSNDLGRPRKPLPTDGVDILKPGRPKIDPADPYYQPGPNGEDSPYVTALKAADAKCMEKKPKRARGAA